MTACYVKLATIITLPVTYLLAPLLSLVLAPPVTLTAMIDIALYKQEKQVKLTPMTINQSLIFKGIASRTQSKTKRREKSQANCIFTWK